MEGKWRPVDEKEDVSRYWMTLRKRWDTVNLKITLCGELALLWAMELSLGQTTE
jgi:hypothetical protein